MPKKDVVEAWYDDGFARAEAERRVREAPDTARGEHLARHNGQGGWGGGSFTKEEAEVERRTCEAIRNRALLARAADHHARARKKQRRLAGKKPVNRGL